MKARDRLHSMDELRALGATPRVHPNGFIQLDLDEHNRLHVWHPRLPYRQRTYHPIHDHVFRFTSHVYSGCLFNVTYNVSFNDKGSHRIHRAKSLGNEESVLYPSEDPPVMVRPQHVERVSLWGEPDFYEMSPHVFHESVAHEPTMTVMTKYGVTAHQGNPLRPRVLVPIGVEPDNGFRRADVDPFVLWQLIADAHPGSRT